MIIKQQIKMIKTKFISILFQKTQKIMLKSKKELWEKGKNLILMHITIGTNQFISINTLS